MDLWQKTLESLRDTVEPYDFQHWIEPIQCDGIDSDNLEIVLAVPDHSHGQWLEENFVDEIRDTLRTFTQSDYRVRFTSNGDYQVDLITDGDDPAPLAGPSGGAPPELIQRYRFDQFVDGPTNQFAMTAARAVAEQPGNRYNPLFIFGGVGLGKTHLLHAIGHAAIKNNPRAKVFYVTSETYVNDLITAIQNNKMQAFRQRYRDDCDILLIDDIQFIAGKDRSQEEFFHMFNTLHSSRKQIVLTCDQLPSSIPDMEDRLRSRLQWGLIADIKPPGFETRVAILKKKAEADGVSLPDDVAMLIARAVTRNVRELEGALMRVEASARMMHREIDLDLVHQTLGDILLETFRRVQPEQIIKAVCQEFKVASTELKGPRRHRNITVPRQIAMYIVRELTDESLPQIGQMFGGRDHSTVINALKRVEAMRDANPDLRGRIDKVRRQLRD